MACNTAVDVTTSRIQRFGDSTKPQNLIGTIDRTIQNLGTMRNSISTLVDNGELLIESIDQSSEAGSLIDPNGDIERQLEEAENGISGEVLAALSRKREAARDDPELQEEYEAGVVNAYDGVITLMKQLHDTTVRLRWTVIEHDADVDELAEGTPEKVYESPADLVQSLIS